MPHSDQTFDGITIKIVFACDRCGAVGPQVTTEQLEGSPDWLCEECRDGAA